MNWSYIAGFIDGDGNIGLMKRKNVKRIEPYVKLISSNKEALQKMSEYIGHGKVMINNKGGTSKPHWSTTHVIILHSREYIKKVLTNCMPDFIIKKHQAELMLDFIKIREGKTRKGLSRTGSTFGLEEYEIYCKMFYINIRRGIYRQYPQPWVHTG